MSGIRAILDGSMERGMLAGRDGLVAGIDEAGRGPLAGPVVAAAVILDPCDVPEGLADSKLLTSARRATLHDVIMARACCVSIAMASPGEVDALNIRAATHLAMRRCAEGLTVTPRLVLVDGHETAGLERMAKGWNVEAIIKGDMKTACIAAASIIAKVTRDRLMSRLHTMMPQYGFIQNQGYGTAEHRAAIHRYGPSRFHRFSFAPIKGHWNAAEFQS